jgi:hypothetical protein
MNTKKLHIYFSILFLLIIFCNKLTASYTVNTPYDTDPALEGRASQASRSAVIYFQNRTTFPLTRTGYSLNGGIWTQTPPYKIPARKQIGWASESSGVLTGTEGSASYSCELISTNVNISWNVPYGGDNSASASAIDTVRPSSRSHKYDAASGVRPDEDNPIIVTIFTPFGGPGVDNLKRQVSQNNLSSVTFLENNSSVNLILVNYSLNNGNWIQKPVPDILPGEWAVWGCGGDNFGGVQLDGSVKYRSQEPNPIDDGEQITDVNIKWISPWNSDLSLGTTTIGTSQSPSRKYELLRTLEETGNHSVIRYNFQHQ